MNGTSRPLLSRVADSVYWMARYIERAENVARYIGVNLNLQFDLPLDPAQQWEPLINTSGDAEAFKESYSEADQDSVIEFLAYDPENPNSIFSCLRAARENARSVREVISSEMWAQVNAMYLQIQSERSLPEPEHLLEAFRQIRLGCHLFQGITDATMTHNEAWHFLRLGRKLERADKTSRILDVKYFMLLPSTRDVGTPYDDIHWSAVLKSVSGFEMYRQKYGRLSPKAVVEFLVIDDEFPRSIHYCMNRADNSLRSITGTSAGHFRYRSEQLMGQLGAELDFTSVEAIIQYGLHEYLDALQEKMNAIDASLREEFVARSPAVQSQSQSQSQGYGRQSQSQSQSNSGIGSRR
jgi:uncharacterized alpha-E superfamily protein